MWSVWLSDRRKQQTKCIFVLIGSLEYFLHVGVKPEQILQSCPVVARFAEELDAALAIYIQHLLSCNRTFWGSIYELNSRGRRGGRSTATPNATGRIKTTEMFSFVLYWVLKKESREGSWIRHFHSTIAWFKTALEMSDLWWTTSMQRNICNHGIIRRFGHSQNVSWYVQEAKSGSVLI